MRFTIQNVFLFVLESLIVLYSIRPLSGTLNYVPLSGRPTSEKFFFFDATGKTVPLSKCPTYPGSHLSDVNIRVVKVKSFCQVNFMLACSQVIQFICDCFA